MVGACDGLVEYEKVYRRGFTYDVFLKAIGNAMDIPTGKKWSSDKVLLYETKSSTWILLNEYDCDAALMVFENAEEAKIRIMVVTVADKQVKPDLGNWWEDANGEEDY